MTTDTLERATQLKAGAPPRHADEDGAFHVSRKVEAQALQIGEAVRRATVAAYDQPLDQMKLNKLTIIAHAIHVARTGRPISDERPIMREQGPVFESLRRRTSMLLHEKGVRDLRDAFIGDGARIAIDEDRRAAIAEAVHLHGMKDALKLAAICHAGGSAFHLAAMAHGWTIPPYTTVSDALFAFCWRQDPETGCRLHVEAVKPMIEASTG